MRIAWSTVTPARVASTATRPSPTPPRAFSRPRVAARPPGSLIPEGDRDARVDPSDVMEWDVVLFADEDGEWSLGKVETFRAGDDACVCQPLYEEASTGLWLESHARPPRSVRLADVRAVVEADFAQRMAPDRVSNPHGEHAEDFWDIIDAARLPPNTRRVE